MHLRVMSVEKDVEKFDFGTEVKARLQCTKFQQGSSRNRRL